MQIRIIIRSLVAATLLLCLAVPASSADVETHVLNETLSLTGSCSKDKQDQVPDPGCPAGPNPPAGPLANPESVSTDAHGNIYVLSAGPRLSGGGIDRTKSRIDIFDSSGHFITELEVPFAEVIAVDADGHLYVAFRCRGVGPGCVNKFVRFDPTIYEPGVGNIEYGNPPIDLPLPTEVFNEGEPTESVKQAEVAGLAIDPTNQHVFAGSPYEVTEYGPAIPGDPNIVLEDKIGETVLRPGAGAGFSPVAIDSAHGLLYVGDTDEAPGATKTVVYVFELEAPYGLVRKIDGTETPQGRFLGNFGQISIAAEETTGNFFVGDINSAFRVHQFAADGSYLATFDRKFEAEVSYIGIDNSPLSPNQGYLFIPSGVTAPGHLFAYRPKPPTVPPVVETVVAENVGEREALIRAMINPEGYATHYVIEYTTEESFEQEGYVGATVADEGDLAPGLSGVNVLAPLSGLAPGTAYRVRVRAESQCLPEGCSAEGEGRFATFAAPLQGGTCANAGLRTGASAALPDCRVYELVTPSDTSGRPPFGPNSGFAGDRFGTPPLRADGNVLAFIIRGGPIPGTDGAGGFNGDAYLATRGPSGWGFALQGPTGEQNGNPSPGGLSPDLGYISWQISEKGGGSLGSAGDGSYVRHPDGSFHLISDNDVGTVLHYLGSAGSHAIFSTPEPRVPGAPAAPTRSIYDRTEDGTLHLVSLLPGNVVPGFEDHATFEGRSDDGSSIAFTILGGPLYVRVDNAETLEGAPPGAGFAGFSADGRFLFYRLAGDLYRFDTEADDTVQITDSGDVEPVDIPASGSGAYFISSSDLADEANPHGDEAITGQPNLYHWTGTEIRFVATLTAEDIEGVFSGIDGQKIGGYDTWMKRIPEAKLGYAPTRSSRQGSTLLFRSRAPLTDDDTGGHVQIYRYDVEENVLTCVSCNLTGAAAGSDASFMTRAEEAPLNQYTLPANLSEDGKRAFFESSERLVPYDNDGLLDVYEWEAEGKGSCRQVGGCLFLISSGESARPSYFFGASASGDDVTFLSSDLLSAADNDETPSVYDARVDGGFAPPVGPAGECLGEACQPAVVAPPVVTPASSVFQGAGNVKQSRCPKGKRIKRVRGKVRCVKKGRQGQKKKNQRKQRSNRQGRSAR